MGSSYLASGDIKLRGTWNNQPISQTECLAKNARMRLAISSFFSSKAKWPASSRWISAPGRSRLNASAPGAMNEGSFHPQTTKVGGLCSSNHACHADRMRHSADSRTADRLGSSVGRVSTGGRIRQSRCLGCNVRDVKCGACDAAWSR